MELKEQMEKLDNNKDAINFIRKVTAGCYVYDKSDLDKAFDMLSSCAKTTSMKEIFKLLKIAKSDCSQHNWEKLSFVLDKIDVQLRRICNNILKELI